MIGSAAPYDIVRKEDRCAATGVAFAEGDRQVAVLVETPGEEALSRLIYAESAWDNGARPEAPSTVFGYWRRVAGEDKAPSGPTISTDELFDLFEQLAGADQARQISFRYLITLLLMRKRRLVYEGTAQDSQDRFVVKSRPGGQLFEVADPRMDSDSIQEATEELGRVINIEADR
ncbi:MAG: hypothetical protein AAGA55_03870 [Planctomycetota bacterium]